MYGGNNRVGNVFVTIRIFVIIPIKLSLLLRLSESNILNTHSMISHSVLGCAICVLFCHTLFSFGLKVTNTNIYELFLQ